MRWSSTVDEIHYVQAFWARDWAGRDPSPAETNVLQVLNSRRKRAAAANPNAAERGAFKLINIRRLEQDRLRPNFLHQLKQVPDSDTALAAALLSCADDAQTLDEKVAALNYHNVINDGDDYDGECDEDAYREAGFDRETETEAEIEAAAELAAKMRQAPIDGAQCGQHSKFGFVHRFLLLNTTTSSSPLAFVRSFFGRRQPQQEEAREHRLSDKEAQQSPRGREAREVIKQFYIKQFTDTGAGGAQDGALPTQRRSSSSRGRVAREVAHFIGEKSRRDTGGSSSLHPTYASLFLLFNIISLI